MSGYYVFTYWIWRETMNRGGHHSKVIMGECNYKCPVNGYWYTLDLIGCCPRCGENLLKQGEVNDKDTANMIITWCNSVHGPFSWPTDGCGYTQHIKFVKHRNANYNGTTEAEFKQFALDYANTLLRGEK